MNFTTSAVWSFASSAKRAVAVGIAVSVAVALLPWHALAAGGRASRNVPSHSSAVQRVIVQFDHTPTKRDLANLKKEGYTILTTIKAINAVVVQRHSRTTPASRAFRGAPSVSMKGSKNLAASLARRKGVVAAVPDVPVRAAGRVVRVLSPSEVRAMARARAKNKKRKGVVEWGVDYIDADLAWKRTRGSRKVVVAVVDTGVDASHPLLRGAVRGGRNFVSWEVGYSPNQWRDANGHGTHVAGIIAARFRPKYSPYRLGVAPKASILAVRVLDRYGSGYLSSLLEGLDWAIRRKVDVINMSLGIYCGGYEWCWEGLSPLRAMLDVARAKGIVVVAAAGNYGEATEFAPGAYDSVISVGAIVQDPQSTTHSVVVPWWSGRGATLDLVAPGKVLSTYLGGQYAIMAGTSMASPHVAGTVALMLSRKPHKRFDRDRNRRWSVDEVVAALRSTADDFADPGFDTTSGWGVVDAEEVVRGRQTR